MTEMTIEELKIAFQSMIPVLAKVPGVTNEMLDFNGSLRDFDALGYFFYEDVLPNAFPDSRKAALYILAQVLCTELGFEWTENLVLKHRKSGITVDIESIEPKEDEGIFSAIEDCYDDVRLTIARRGLLAKD